MFAKVEVMNKVLLNDEKAIESLVLDKFSKSGVALSAKIEV